MAKQTKPQRHQSPPLDKSHRARRALAAAGHAADHLARMSDAEIDALAELIDESGDVVHLDAAGQPISARTFGRAVRAAKTVEEKPRISLPFARRFAAAFEPHAARMAGENAGAEQERQALAAKGLMQTKALGGDKKPGRQRKPKQEGEPGNEGTREPGAQ